MASGLDDETSSAASSDDNRPGTRNTLEGERTQSHKTMRPVKEVLQCYLLCCSWGALYYWDIPTATGTLSAAMEFTNHMTWACRLSQDKLTQTLLRCNVIVICAQQWGVKTEYAPCGAPNVLVVEDLKPSSAYMFRLFECGEDGSFGEPRPEVTFHTQGVSSRPR